MLQVSSAAWIHRRAAPFAVFSAACVREKMNSEVGIRDADFTYIYKKSFPLLKSAYGMPTLEQRKSASEVPTSNNEFSLEVGIRDADFRTVKVGIRNVGFLLFLYGISWKSADGLPTSAQWKSVIQVPTSICAQCFLFEIFCN